MEQEAVRKLPASQQAMRNLLYWTHESMALAVIWNSPLTRVAERVARLHLRRQVKDRWLRRQLTPDFTIGCKRVLVSNDYYPALQKDNAKLITWPIARLSEKGFVRWKALSIRPTASFCYRFRCQPFRYAFPGERAKGSGAG